MLLLLLLLLLLCHSFVFPTFSALSVVNEVVFAFALTKSQELRVKS